MSILILGAGELGIEVIKHVALHQSRRDTPVSVLLRSDPQEARQALSNTLKQLKVSVVLADVVKASQDELSSIFGKYHTVISCNGMTLPPEVQPKLAQAAIQGRVQRYFPWQFGIDYDVIGRNSEQDLFDAQLDVRDILRTSDMPWVIVSTGMFISFLFEPAFGLVNTDRTQLTALGSWDNALTVTAPEDIGRLTAELALVHTDVQGVVYVSGDTITMAQLGGIIETISGRAPERQLKTVADLESELASDPQDGMKKYRVVFGRGRGVAWPKADSLNARLSVPTQSVLEWAKKHLP